MLEMIRQITLEHFYIGCASIGGALFLVRIILLVMGGDDGDGADGVDGDGDFSSAHDSDVSFKVLSLQGITGFFLMFGLVGWAILKQAPEGAAWNLASFGGGSAAGLITMWVLAWIFSIMNRLQSTGNLDLKEAIGEEGLVYLTIPMEGMGKVRVQVRGGLKEFDALSREHVEIKTGERVRVVGLVETNVLMVQRAENPA